MNPAPPVTSARTAGVSHRPSRAVENLARCDHRTATEDRRRLHHRARSDLRARSEDRAPYDRREARSAPSRSTDVRRRPWPPPRRGNGRRAPTPDTSDRLRAHDAFDGPDGHRAGLTHRADGRTGANADAFDCCSIPSGAARSPSVRRDRAGTRCSSPESRCRSSRHRKRTRRARRLGARGSERPLARSTPGVRAGIASEDFGIEHVDPRVDEVGWHLVGRGLLQEGEDPPVGVGRHHPERGGVLDRRQRDGRLAAGWASWKATSAPRSRSVSTSPFTTTRRSRSNPTARAANAIAPAVSSGSGSTA